MYDMIFIDGVDRTGKSSLLNELCKQSNYRFVINDRALLSCLAYNYKFNRPHKFDMNNYKNVIHIYLTADTEILAQRFINTNEPPLYDNLTLEEGIDKDKEIFDLMFGQLQHLGFKAWKYDTSNTPTRDIAKDIIERIDNLNKELEVNE